MKSCSPRLSSDATVLPDAAHEDVLKNTSHNLQLHMVGLAVVTVQTNKCFKLPVQWKQKGVCVDISPAILLLFNKLKLACCVFSVLCFVVVC